MQSVIYSLGRELENALAEEVKRMARDKVIKVEAKASQTEKIMDFGDYCAIGALAVKY